MGSDPADSAARVVDATYGVECSEKTADVDQLGASLPVILDSDASASQSQRRHEAC